MSLPIERNEWVFRTPQQNEVMASALVEHMKSKGYKTLGFIGFSDAYGEDWLNSVTKHAGAAGIQLAVVERYARNDTSVTGQVLKLTMARPDAVLIAGSGSPAALPQGALIVTPGIQPLEFAKGDHARFTTASEAIKAGATHVVVGRPISRALNPAASFAALCAELEV